MNYQTFLQWCRANAQHGESMQTLLARYADEEMSKLSARCAELEKLLREASNALDEYWAGDLVKRIDSVLMDSKT